MYSVLSGFFADKKGGEIFTLFSGWHFFYIVATVAAITVILILLRKKGQESRVRVTRALIGIAFGLSMADFFLMPLAYGEIDIEKLPFHACTAMCVACFLSFWVKPLEKLRTSFAMLGLLSNLTYLIYPAGVMWYGVHPLSYRVIQTLIFHSVMTVFCLLVLIYERKRINIKRCYRELFVVVGMTLWALLGNYVYSGSTDSYSRVFNWFFVVGDPLGWLPADIAPYVMPFLNIVLFFAVEMVIHLVFLAVKKGERAAVEQTR